MESDKPIRLVTLVGSLRQASFNAAIARTLPQLIPDDVTISALGSIGEFSHYNEDVVKTDGFPQAVVEMADAIRQSDGVIIVTPEYNYSVPGTLKNALDWLSRLPSPPFSTKCVLIQSAAPGLLGGGRAQYHLRQILVSLNAQVFNKPEVMVSNVVGKVDTDEHELVDPATRDFIAGQLAAFLTFVRAAAQLAPAH